MLGVVLASMAACAIGAPKSQGTLRIQCILPGEFAHYAAKSWTKGGASESMAHSGELYGGAAYRGAIYRGAANSSGANNSTAYGGAAYRRAANSNGANNSTAPRLIGPQSGWQIASYRLTCTSNEGEIITKTLVRASGDITLKVGGWNILAEGLAADGSVIVENQTQIDVSAGRTINLPINLHLAKGKGSVQITFLTTQTPNASWKYCISLEFLGLPGDAAAEGPPAYTTEFAATEQSFNATDLPSGYYRLAVQLKDTTQAAIAGSIETILVLPGRISAGNCDIVLADPSINISLTVPLLELSAKTAIGVDRFLNKNRKMLVPLAVAEENANLGINWFANGEAVGGGLEASNHIEASNQMLAGYRLHFGTIDEPGAFSFLKMDALLSDPDTKLAQVLTQKSTNVSPPLAAHAEWIQSMDYRAALTRPLHDNGDPANQGTGVASDTKWVTASSNGLIAVAGLDKSSAVHLFYSPAGQEATDSNGMPVILPAESGWIRLWRDKVVIEKSERSPDRVSLSGDGSLLAVGSSSSNWLRVYVLDTTGAIVAKKDMVSGKNGAPAFANIKALKFSPDAKKLVVLANSPEKILVFNVENPTAGQLVPEAEFLFASCFENPPSSSLGMEDLALLSDGWIAACSSNIARIFLVHYSDNQFSSATTYASGANGESLGDPKSIVFDEQNSLMYILGYSKKLHVFSKIDGYTGYQPVSTISLTNEFDKARSLALARTYPSSSFLVAGGGQSMGIIALDATGQPSTQSSLASVDANYAGIASITNIAALGDTIVAATGTSGLISVFNIF